MAFLNGIPRLPLYSRLLVPVIFVGCLLLFIILQGQKPDPLLQAFSFDAILRLDPAIWVMVITGLTGFLLGSWIWIMQPKSLPALLFGLSGLATLMFTFSPLPYYFKTPVSADAALLMSQANLFGASLFGAVMSALLLIYPSRLPLHKYLLPILCAVFFVWTIWASRDAQRLGYFVQLITCVQMLCIVAFSIWQIFASRRAPDKRAVAIWLSACVIVGSGPFIALVAAPTVFGRELVIPPHYAFAFFNLVYIGFAVGLLRLRLFELGSWAFQLLFHAGLAILFIAIDLALVSTLTVQTGTALTLTALGLAAVYLPLRGWLSGLVRGRRNINESDMFQSVIETGLKPSGEARAVSWVNLLKQSFSPAQISENKMGGHAVSISADGQSLSLPAAMDAPALTLRHKYEGRSLFNARDQKLAEQILALINQVDDSRRAYDRGVNEERSRIGRDIHDNIGAQLLHALHSEKSTRKDEMIRESLSDLRDVINNSSSVDMPLSDMLADLRVETAERVESHGIELNWQADDFGALELPSHQLHMLRSVMREAISNVVKHAKATQLNIDIDKVGQELKFRIEDNGQGLKNDGKDYAPGGGHGLKNMRARIEGQGGEFALETSDVGTCLTASFAIEGAAS